MQPELTNCKKSKLTIQILIYYLIYSCTPKVFCKIMQHMFEILVFNRRLINNILCFKPNWFDLKLKILNLHWRQEIMHIVFYFTWHTQNIVWEIIKFLGYFENVYPSFHEHFLLMQSSYITFFCSVGEMHPFFLFVCLSFHFLEMFTLFFLLSLGEFQTSYFIGPSPIQGCSRILQYSKPLK